MSRLLPKERVISLLTDNSKIAADKTGESFRGMDDKPGSRFWKMIELTLEPWAFTLRVAKVGLQASGFCRVGSYEENPTHFQDALLPLLKGHKKQVLSFASYMAESEKAVGVSKMYVEQMEAFASGSTIAKYTVPDRLVVL